MENATNVFSMNKLSIWFVYLVSRRATNDTYFVTIMLNTRKTNIQTDFLASSELHLPNRQLCRHRLPSIPGVTCLGKGSRSKTQLSGLRPVNTLPWVWKSQVFVVTECTRTKRNKDILGGLLVLYEENQMHSYIRALFSFVQSMLEALFNQLISVP
jgi:hypothetical protein